MFWYFACQIVFLGVVWFTLFVGVIVIVVVLIMLVGFDVIYLLFRGLTCVGLFELL